jgi:hypothetical protein
MMTHRSNDRGTLMIDRILPTVGRIAKASGTHDEAVHRAIVGQRVKGRPRIPGMLDLLHTPLRRLDLLRAIRDGRVKAIEVYHAWQSGQLEALRITGAEQPLKPAVEAWLDAIPNVETRRGYRGELTRAGAMRAGLAVHELPALLRAYRLGCKGRGVFRAFNLARSAAQAFLRETLGTRSTEYAEVLDLKPLPRTTPRKLPPAPTHEEFLERCAKLPLKAARCVQGMAYSGMNPKEFWGAWEQRPDRTHIQGTKRGGRVRDVPFIAPIERPQVSRVTLKRALAKHWPGVTPKHCRNFFARWLDEAGVPEVRREMYLGHGEQLHNLYPRAELDGYLVSDGEKVQKYLKLTTKDLLRVEKAG